MRKDFDNWNERKKVVDLFDDRKSYFSEGEIWWIYAGLNIGFEENGKGDFFSRPVLIVKKFNQHLLLVVPLSSAVRENNYRISCIASDGVLRTALISQIKAVSGKRLQNKISFLKESEFGKIKNAIRLFF